MSHMPYLCLLHIYTYCPCLTGGAEGLPAVVLAGGVVAFLVLTLLIAGSTIGVVLWRIVNRRRTLQDTKWIEHTETNEEMSGNGQVSVADHSEQCVEEDEQHAQDMHYEVCDIMGQGCCGREDSNGIGFEGDCYANVEIAENILSEEEVRDGVTKTRQHDDQPKGIANAVYGVVDVARATTTHDIYTDEQHYEYNSVFGQHWSDKLVGGMPKENSEVEQGCPSNAAKKTCSETESFHPTVVYDVADVARATTTHDIYTDEQHYEYSSVCGQHWSDNLVGGMPKENSEVEQRCPSNDAKKTCPQTESFHSNAMSAVVDTDEQHYEYSSVFGQHWSDNLVGGMPKENSEVEQGCPSNDAKKTCAQTESFHSNAMSAVVDTDEQHYEYSSVFGQHWSDNLVGGMPKENSEVEQGCPSNDAKKTCAQTESFHSNAMSAVVDTDEQHYEYSSVFGQHWSDNLVGGMPKENSEVEQGCPSNDAKKTCAQTESFHSNAMSAVVDTDEQHYEYSSVFGQDWLGNVPTGMDKVEGQ